MKIIKYHDCAGMFTKRRGAPVHRSDRLASNAVADKHGTILSAFLDAPYVPMTRKNDVLSPSLPWPGQAVSNKR